uniref:Nuclear receptor domain-containing protein n=1 Tax=Caenorhabditis tropicalis TaxID=1561998 RepID=A0A1I7TI64_9PELO
MVRGKCTVCDSPNATNYHFGAQSCKACAAFFRRSIAMGQAYDCLGDGIKSCKIDHTLRLNCRHCRLKKCLKAGMVKDLVQAKREVKPEKTRNSSDDISPLVRPDVNTYFDQYPSTSSEVVFYSENEWDFCPRSPKSRKLSSENLMGIDELQQFIQIPSDEFQMIADSAEIRSRMTSFSESSAAYISGLEEEDRLFGIAALYTDQVINLNMRRRITYTDKLLGTVFDGPCICPYDKSDLKTFDHRTYRQKNRNDYTMILDYINRFPEFQLLSKSEKIVLFRTAAAVDVLVDQAYYSQIIFPNEDVLVTANGEALRTSPNPLIERDSGDFSSDEDYDKYKMLTSMKLRQWHHVCEPLKKLNMSLTEFSLFKALTIWHYNYYKLQETGRQVCSRQRDDIFRTLLLICDDEGHEDALLRASEIVLAVGIAMAEVHEMVTSYIEITVYDVLDDPILKDMLKFQY